MHVRRRQGLAQRLGGVKCMLQFHIDKQVCGALTPAIQAVSKSLVLQSIVAATLDTIDPVVSKP
jgi:hypothetical protein